MNGPFCICFADYAGYLLCQDLISFGVSYILSISYFDQIWTKFNYFRVGSKSFIFPISTKLSPKQPLSEPFLLLQIS